MKIRIFGQSGEKVFPFGVMGPWVEFKNTLLKLGHEIATDDLNEEVDAVIAHTCNKFIAEYIKKRGIPKTRCILVIWEPSIVNEKQRNKKMIELFGHIFAPSVIWAKQLEATSFYWPQDYVEIQEVKRDINLRKNRAVIIQGNKFSAHKEELYSLRRKVLVVDRARRIDLIGTNWNQGLIYDLKNWLKSISKISFSNISLRTAEYLGLYYPNYRGSASDKNAILNQYKVAIVIENSADFVSEKLFDAVRNGCVVIYIGPNLDIFGIDNNSFITCSTNSEIILSKLEEVMLLDNEKLLQIVENQVLEITRIIDYWDNMNVLPKLALNISAKLN